MNIGKAAKLSNLTIKAVRYYANIGLVKPQQNISTGYRNYKDEELAKFAGSECFWIEDKPENCKAGEDVGLNPILVAHDHNKWAEDDYPRYWKWKHIYKYIIGEY